MEKMINEMKEELLGKELTLLEMDNAAMGITGATEGVFDYLNDCLEQHSVAYSIAENKNIVVEFEIIADSEDKTEATVKVTDVWED